MSREQPGTGEKQGLAPAESTENGEPSGSQPSPQEKNALVALFAAGRYTEAITLAEMMAERFPLDGFVWKVIGASLQMQGKDPLYAMQKATELLPLDAEANHNLGIAYKSRGNLDNAVASYRRTLKIKPDFAEAHSNLGTAQSDQGAIHDAAVSYRRALAIKPDLTEAQSSLGNTQRNLGRFDDAIASCRRALAVKSDFVEARSNLGDALRELGHLDDAVASYRRTLIQKPDYVEAYNNLGATLRDQGKLDEAVRCFGRALNHRPDYAEAHSNLGAVLTEQGKLEEAVTSCRRAPNFADALNNLGNALQEQGKLDEAVLAYGQALDRKPDFSLAEMNLSFTHLYRSDDGLTGILARSHRWNERHAARFQDRWPLHRRPSGGAHPRIGFVSADFYSHAVGLLVVPAIEGLARLGYHLTCYSNSVKSDKLTARLVTAATVWRTVIGLSDDALAALIRDDGIDILIDLSGYSAGNRLLVFARKPAPIQVASWIGYPATTGLKAMDYILADRWQVPTEAERYYSEAVVRLPDSYVAFEPPVDAPPVGDPPVLSQDRITFGSFNVLKKITPEVVAVWGRILTRMPNSRLLMKTRALNCAATRQHYARLFADHKISEERLIFVGGTPRAQHMSWMQRTDIALDPFPYSGGQTTLEALWMGLPVITLPHDTFCSRHTLGYLSNIGLSELAATSIDHYVELAVNLANDSPRLANVRSGLRSRMLAAPLCDVDRFSRDLAAALTMMWHRWCDGLPATSFDIS